jgi:hypothetical protein
MKEQRRGQRIAMTRAERDAFLEAACTCRVATVDADGNPHNSPLWFVWDGEAMWLNTLVRSQRWTNLERDARVSILVDAGEDYHELCGVELLGTVASVGTVPRTQEPDAALELPERLFADKYGGGVFVADGAHAWLRLVPT